MNVFKNVLKKMWEQIHSPAYITSAPEDDELYGHFIDRIARNTGCHPALVTGIRANIEAITGKPITSAVIFEKQVLDRASRMSPEENLILSLNMRLQTPQSAQLIVQNLLQPRSIPD